MTRTSRVQECTFCGHPLTIPFAFEIPNPEDPPFVGLADASALDPGWRIIFTGSGDPTVVCPSCLPSLQTVVDAIEGAIDTVLERRRA